MKITVQEKADAIKQVKKWLPAGSQVFTVLKHVSASGMYRRIAVLIVVKNKHSKQQEILNISWYVAQICGYRDCDGSVGVSGCGMDMGFAVVYNLASCLYPKGDGRYVTGRNGATTPETDGGYCLDQYWL